VKLVKDLKTRGRSTAASVIAAFVAAFTSLILFTSLTAHGLQRTVRDKIYTKEQAARGAELYGTYCDKCHDPAKLPEGKKPPPPIVGDKFKENWQDKTLGELYTTVLTTMPSDASTVLTPEQTLDLLAHLLKLNEYPEGTAPLKNDDATKAIVIVR
jgi:mono/diheme cytochrome c family protein